MEDLALKQYVSEMIGYKRLTNQQMVALSKQLKEGDEDAFNTMVNSNLSIALAAAKAYIRPGFTLLECVSYANEGLMNAVRKWNPDTSNNFVSYAYRCIRSKLRDGTRTERLMPISDYTWKKITKIIHIQESLTETLDHEPTPHDISRYLNGEMTPFEIQDLLNQRRGVIDYYYFDQEEDDQEN